MDLFIEWSTVLEFAATFSTICRPWAWCGAQFAVSIIWRPFHWVENLSTICRLWAWGGVQFRRRAMSRVGKVGSSLHCLQIKSLDGLINPQTVRHNVETKLLASFPLSSAKPANVSYHIYFQASCKLSAKPANIYPLSFGHIDTISLSIFEIFNKFWKTA